MYWTLTLNYLDFYFYENAVYWQHDKYFLKNKKNNGNHVPNKFVNWNQIHHELKFENKIK